MESRITFLDWVDKTAVYGCLSIFFSGCSHYCVGCHNKELQKWKPYQYEEVLLSIVKKIEKTPIKHLVFTGGDPLYEKNRGLTKYLLKELSALGYHIMIYTGCEIEDVDEDIFQYIDYIKCGKFDLTLKNEGGDPTTFVLASKNQKIYDRYKNLLTVDGVLIKEKEEKYA